MLIYAKNVLYLQQNRKKKKETNCIPVMFGVFGGKRGVYAYIHLD